MITIFTFIAGFVQKIDFKSLIMTGIKPWRAF